MRSILRPRSPAITSYRQESTFQEPPEIRQLRLQIHQLQDQITQATRDQQKIPDQIKIYQGRVALSPAVEEQYKELTRDYETAAEDSTTMIWRRRAFGNADRHGARAARRADARADSGRSSRSPEFPNRLFFAGGGLAGGLGDWLGLGLWLEFRDQSVRTERMFWPSLNCRCFPGAVG